MPSRASSFVDGVELGGLARWPSERISEVSACELRLL